MRSLFPCAVLCLAAVAGVFTPPAAAAPAGPADCSYEVKWWFSGTDRGRRTVVIAGGSATVLRAARGKSLLVTNAHVFTARDYAPSSFERYAVVVDGVEVPARKLRVARVGDLALVECDKELPVAPLTRDLPAAGAAVYQYGFHGHVRREKTGRYVAYAPDNLTDDEYGNAKTITSTLRPEDGDSGSGLFDAAGRLFAVSYSVPSVRPTVGLHVPAHYVFDLLADYDARAGK